MSLPPECAASWLTHAYGEEEAERIMRLPGEVQANLYSEIYRYGPAGEQVAAVAHALIFTLSSLNKKWLTHSLEKIRAANPPFQFPRNASPGSFMEWLGSPGYQDADENIRRDFGGSLPNGGVRGMQAFLWMLNGQYVFPPHMVDLFTPHVDEANLILASLGFRPLGGLLALEEEKRVAS